MKRETDSESYQHHSHINRILVRRNAIFWTTLLLILLFLPAWWFTDYWYHDHLLTEQKNQDNIELHLLKNSLDVSISNRFGLLEGLWSFAESNPTEQQLKKEYEIFASGLHASFNGIRNFSLAPGGVLQYVYPIKGNEKIIGHDLINDERPSVRADVQRTIETRKIILSGPYELQQGGLGLVARKAVFVDNSFWGLAAMVIDIPPILEDAGFLLKTSDINLALRDKTSKVFWGQSAVFDSQPLIVQIELPDGYWELAGAPVGGWYSAIKKKLFVFRAISFLIVSLSTLLIFVLINRHQSLIDSNERFRSLSNATFEGIAITEKGIFLEVNDNMCKMFGYQGKDLIGMVAMDLVTPESREIIKKHILSGHEQIYEADGLRKDNSIFPLEIQAKMFLYKGHETRVTALRDITERKQSEMQREKLINQLQKALDEIKTLKGIVPICSHCKKIRDDQGYWNILESYIQKHSEASFSHGICPECSDKFYGDQNWYVEMKEKKEKK